MKLRVLSTGSIGNCYLLENEEECLIIDLGVKFKEVKKALNFDISKISGVIQSHYHQDHCKGSEEALKSGVSVYMSETDKEGMNLNHHRIEIIEPKKSFKVGNFKILPFDVEHDVPCLGFLINHKETGNVLYITDTMYCGYKFKNLNNIIVEANYCPVIVKENNKDKKFLWDRVLQSHMSIETTLELLESNDLSKVNNIVLIHLSDRNSDEKSFKERTKEATGKNVFVANAGKVIDFNKTPF